MITTKCFLDFIKLFGVICHINPRLDYNDFGHQVTDGMEVDFIVIGGGSGGATVAGRLAEVSSWEVLVLEAGGFPTVHSEIPYLSVKNFESNLNWGYTTEPEPNLCQNSGGRCWWPMGKGLGGTSTINGMIYARGIPEDFDSWKAQGNVGWGWEDVLPYFQKMEGAVGRENEGIGRDGPLTLTYHRAEHELRDAYFRAAVESGTEVHDHEAKFGVFENYLTIRNGTRCSSAKAYLSKKLGFDNIHISLQSRVTKILTKENRAIGVEIYKNGKIINVYASKEVIISAGTTHSPQLLMLSGIGPQAHLKDMGIPLVSNLPVGKHLQDHIIVNGLAATITPINNSYNIFEESMRYCTKRKGKLNNIGLLNIAWFIDTNKSNLPNVQIVRVYTPSLGPEIQDCEDRSAEITDTFRTIRNTHDVLSFVPVLIAPKSLGEITLASKDPFAQPLIRPNYLSAYEDEEALLESVAHVKKFLATPTMSGYKAELFDINIDQCSSMKFDTEDYWKCIIKYTGNGAFHAVGTCKMGPDRFNSVVDSNLKVHGFENLRVVDASVMPTIISRNTNAGVIMIGEKAADMIKSYWSNVYAPKYYSRS